jgi:hypothetical protein
MSSTTIDGMKIISMLLSGATLAIICVFMVSIYYKLIDIKWNYNSKSPNAILESISKAVNEIFDSKFGIPLIFTIFIFLYNDFLNQILKKLFDNQNEYNDKSPKMIHMLKKILLFVGITGTLSVIHLAKMNKLYNYEITTTPKNNSSNETNFGIDSVKKCRENTTIVQKDCWENGFAFDIYNYLWTYLAFMVLSLVLREWLPFVHKCSQKSFDSTRNAFDLIYIQLLCWLTTFYSPFAPIFACIIFLIIFYIKRLSIAVFHKPKIQKSQTIDLSIWIFVSLLFGLVVSFLSPLFTIFK